MLAQDAFASDEEVGGQRSEVSPEEHEMACRIRAEHPEQGWERPAEPRFRKEYRL